eukprot:GFYU01003641.1.p1 GENE.GFYU01003641.1~~GFYU01003641.1.p1  ORF type:complete len:289 (-),score=82.03 GFYU01003641.1:234-1070(-)
MCCCWCCCGDEGCVIVDQYESAVLFRFGQHIKTLTGGLHWVTPCITTVSRVDMRTEIHKVAHASYITSDNVVVDIDFAIFFKVDNAEKAILEVESYKDAVSNLGVAALRQVVGTNSMANCLSEREKIRDAVTAGIKEPTARWGIKVHQVEINEIRPPRGVQHAMEQEKSSVSLKIAEITRSEGERQASINISEGEKKAAIMKAEGDSQRAIMLAEAEKRAKVLRAEGQAEALGTVNQVVSGLHGNTMTLEYLKVLEDTGKVANTKMILPMEFLELRKK